MSERAQHVDLVKRFNHWQPDPAQAALLAANRRILELEADLARWQRIARDRLRTLKAERKARDELVAKITEDRDCWQSRAELDDDEF